MSKSLSPHLDETRFFGSTSPLWLTQVYGSPLYVYNENILRQNCQALRNLSSYPGFQVNYSVKANANPFLLRIIHAEGLIVDAMSPGELYLDRLAGFSRDEILYISNNNSVQEMANALAQGVLISVDSLSQLEQLGNLAPHSKVMVRFNPGIGRGHSEKVITAGKKTKFGIMPEDLQEVLSILERHNLILAGVNQHIGSLFMEPEGYLEAAAVLLDLVAKLPEPLVHNLEIIDFGGGFGIPYHKHAGEASLDLQTLGQALHTLITDFATNHHFSGRFLVEPGRYIMAEACALVGTVTAIKENAGHRFTGTDIGFNVLMRPMLYDAYHEIEVIPHRPDLDRTQVATTVTGNICESGDILAKARLLPKMYEGDLILVLDSGAYGYSMASTYNQRTRPAEVLIRCDGSAQLIRRAETIQDLTAGFADLFPHP